MLCCNEVAISSVKGNSYTIYFGDMSKYEAINKMKNADLSEKSGSINNV